MMSVTEAEALSRLMANPRVQAVRARIDEARATFVDRSLWSNPIASFSRESVAASHDVFLLGRQDLPMSGRLGRLRTAGDLGVQAAEAEARFAVSEVQWEMRRAFTSLLAAQEREATQVQSLAGLEQLVAILRLREEAGEGSRYDRLRGERALIDLEADVSTTGIAMRRARVELAAFLEPGTNPETLLADGVLEVAATLPPVAELIARALAVRADLRAGAARIGQFEEERRAAAALRIPTPSLTYGLKRSGVEDVTRNGYLLSFDVTVPLFNRGQGAVALATAQAVRSRAELEFLRLRIEADVRAAHAALTLQQAREAEYRRAVGTSASSLAEIARTAYEEGELGILELLDANRQLLDARLRMIDLAAGARLAAIDLDRATGLELQP